MAAEMMCLIKQQEFESADNNNSKSLEARKALMW